MLEPGKGSHAAFSRPSLPPQSAPPPKIPQSKRLWQKPKSSTHKRGLMGINLKEKKKSPHPAAFLQYPSVHTLILPHWGSATSFVLQSQNWEIHFILGQNHWCLQGEEGWSPIFSISDTFPFRAIIRALPQVMSHYLRTNNQQSISLWCFSVPPFKRQDKKLSPSLFPWRNRREMAQARAKPSELQDDHGRRVFITFFIILEFSESQTSGKPYSFFFFFVA